MSDLEPCLNLKLHCRVLLGMMAKLEKGNESQIHFWDRWLWHGAPICYDGKVHSLLPYAHAQVDGRACAPLRQLVLHGRQTANSNRNQRSVEFWQELLRKAGKKKELNHESTKNQEHHHKHSLPQNKSIPRFKRNQSTSYIH